MDGDGLRDVIAKADADEFCTEDRSEERCKAKVRCRFVQTAIAARTGALSTLSRLLHRALLIRLRSAHMHTLVLFFYLSCFYPIFSSAINRICLTSAHGNV